MVFIRSGPEKGKKGKVLKVLRKRNLVVVEGINITRRRRKTLGATQEEEEIVDPRTGAKTTKPGFYKGLSPIHVHRVSLIDPVTKRPGKIKYKMIDGVKQRVAARTGNVIPKPPPTINLEKRKRLGPKDTPPNVALKKTFDPQTLNPLKLASLNHKEINVSQNICFLKKSSKKILCWFNVQVLLLLFLFVSKVVVWVKFHELLATTRFKKLMCCFENGILMRTTLNL